MRITREQGTTEKASGYKEDDKLDFCANQVFGIIWTTFIGVRFSLHIQSTSLESIPGSTTAIIQSVRFYKTFKCCVS